MSRSTPRKEGNYILQAFAQYEKQPVERYGPFVEILGIYASSREKKEWACLAEALNNPRFNKWVKDNEQIIGNKNLNIAFRVHTQALAQAVLAHGEKIRILTGQEQTDNPNESLHTYIRDKKIDKRYKSQDDLISALEEGPKLKAKDEIIKHLIKRNFLDQILNETITKLDTARLEVMLGNGLEQVNAALKSKSLNITISKEQYKEELLSGTFSKMKTLISQIDTEGTWIKEKTSAAEHEKTSAAEHAATSSWGWGPFRRGGPKG